MLENRRHFRVREILDIQWSVEGQEAKGEGKILNLSTSGILLQTDKVFKISQECVVSVSTPEGPLALKKGKVVWFRKIADGKKYVLGIEFLKKVAYDKSLNDWVEGKITLLAQAGDAKIINNYLS